MWTIIISTTPTSNTLPPAIPTPSMLHEWLMPKWLIQQPVMIDGTKPTKEPLTLENGS